VFDILGVIGQNNSADCLRRLCLMTNSPETRDSLLLQIRDPDNRVAWDRFTQIYRPIVYRLARRRGLQEADADDLWRSVLLSVSRSIQDWQRNPDSRFYHWLRRVAGNAILNALTRGPRDPAVGGSDFLNAVHEVAQHDEDAERDIEREYQRQIYRRAAEVVRQSIQEDTWRAFERKVVDGESTESVATDMGKSIGNVHAARSRVMRRLQVVVAELLETER